MTKLVFCSLLRCYEWWMQRKRERIMMDNWNKFLKTFPPKKELWQSFIINAPFFTWLHHKQTYLFTNKSQTLFWNNLIHLFAFCIIIRNILMKYISWKYCQILHFDISRLINRFTKTFRLHTSANENGILNRNAVHCSCSKRELFYLTSNILRQNMMMMFFVA